MIIEPDLARNSTYALAPHKPDEPSMSRLVCRCSAYTYPHAFNSGLCTYTTATEAVFTRRLCHPDCPHYRHVVGTPGYCRALSAESENCPALAAVCRTGTVSMADSPTPRFDLLKLKNTAS
jgi:hypothetical protein